MNITQKDIIRWIWQQMNDKGFGHAPCGHEDACRCDINKLENSDLLLVRASAGKEYPAIYVDNDGEWVLVYDANGPWAQFISWHDIQRLVFGC